MLTIAGLQFGQREAIIYWPDWTERGKFIEAGLEEPVSVEVALKRAEQLRVQHGFKRVVLWLQHLVREAQTIP